MHVCVIKKILLFLTNLFFFLPFFIYFPTSLLSCSSSFSPSISSIFPSLPSSFSVASSLSLSLPINRSISLACICTITTHFSPCNLCLSNNPYQLFVIHLCHPSFLPLSPITPCICYSFLHLCHPSLIHLSLITRFICHSFLDLCHLSFLHLSPVTPCISVTSRSFISAICLSFICHLSLPASVTDSFISVTLSCSCICHLSFLHLCHPSFLPLCHPSLPASLLLILSSLPSLFPSSLTLSCSCIYHPLLCICHPFLHLCHLSPLFLHLSPLTPCILVIPHSVLPPHTHIQTPRPTRKFQPLAASMLSAPRVTHCLGTWERLPTRELQ